MDGCDATLTVCTVTDDVVAIATRGATEDWWRIWMSDLPDGTAMVRDGDRLMRLDVQTLTCERTAGHERKGMLHHGGEQVSWSDEDKGATPPTPLCGEQSLYHTTCVKPAGHDGQHDDDPRVLL